MSRLAVKTRLLVRGAVASRPARFRLAYGVAVVLAFVLHVVSVRQVIPVSRAFLENGMTFNVPFLLAAGACWWRSRAQTQDRRAWLLLACGFLSFLGGNLYTSQVLHNDFVYPSPADAMWLMFYVFVYLALSLFTKAHAARFLASTWRLDGAIGAFGAAAVIVSLYLAPSLELSGGRLADTATNVAYPTADVLLLMLLIFVGNGLRHSGPSWWMLTIGFSLFLVGDVYYLWAEANETYVPSASSFEFTWSGGVTIIALSALIPVRRAVPRGTLRLPYLMPALFTVAAIGLLVYGQHHDIPGIAVILCVITLALAGLRTLLTVREVHRLAASREEARTDYLTQLPNRRHLSEAMAVEVARESAPTSLIVIDLDRFKEVNDSLGHAAGDDLLRKVGQRLSSQVRGTSMLARLGGDEFAMLLPDHNADRATTVALSIRDRLREPFQVSGIPVTAQASIGVASAPEHARSAAELLAYADIAMYQAKRTEDGVAAFRVEAANPSLDRLELLGGLHGALSDGQLVIHYQPQLDLRTSEVHGVEALVRWQHPRRGMLLPGDFLPMVIEMRLMTAVTELVLSQSLADWTGLRDGGQRVRMSVNISAIELANPALPSQVEQLVRTYEVAPQQLVLEITEGAVFEDEARSSAVLQDLRDIGVAVSVDDYGTGRASLSYLRDFPLDEIKLDRRFLVGAPMDTHNAAIVRSTIGLAHDLGLPLVVEGVENADTLSWLGELGCDLVQGYHIARPMPRSDLQSWLTEFGQPLATAGAPA